MSSIDTVFYYSTRFVLDNHHLSTDNIKFMSQQIIIVRLRRGFDSGIELYASGYNTISKYFTVLELLFHLEHVSNGKGQRLLPQRSK